MNSWDSPKRVYKKPSKVKVFSGSWRDVPWAELYKECARVQQEAVATAQEANLQRYTDWIEEKRQELQALDPESGSYEGDLGERYPFKKISADKLVRIKVLASTKTCEDFVVVNSIKSFAPQLLTEIVKHISTYKLSTVDGEAYDPKRLETDNSSSAEISSARLYRSVFTDDTMQGLYQFLMMDTRSSYLDKQYTAPNKSWCALVPLVMSAFKIHHNVPYAHWNQRELVGIVQPKLYDAMCCETPVFSKTELLEARQEGLMTKTGPNAGKLRNPVYTHKLWGVRAFENIPEYAQTMLTQIWCAHPNNRTRYMILDPDNWDKIPEPLITTDVLVPKISWDSIQHTTDTDDLPWN